ncbi:phytanoyl-CoA dioxygenase family protein [uncultured Roseovarius sp.]|uniref:phytanoyl-CoA dioxygenase family protein n=1 Tax=uncultured Roseovarius sp. TaxID=293344 RepID=UPI002605474D|nr:phytanoyl-CoA dioxygenase family protein [uncultured Roseovarius sp.]
MDKVQSFDAASVLSNAEAIDAFNSDGVVCLRQAISPDWRARIEEGIVAALSGASTDLDVVKASGDSGKFTVSSQAWQKVDQFRRYIFESPLADLSQYILQSKTLTLFYDFLLIKEANSNSAATPWHQDHSYYPLSGTKVINCWTALDPIPLETALRFWKGSHLSGIVYRAANFENPSKPYKYARDSHPPLPEIEADPNAKLLATAMAPGDLLIFSSRVLHAAPGNRLDRRRAGFSINWVGDDVTYDDVPALETYRDPSLRTGDRIDICAKFPMVRPT